MNLLFIDYLGNICSREYSSDEERTRLIHRAGSQYVKHILDVGDFYELIDRPRRADATVNWAGNDYQVWVDSNGIVERIGLPGGGEINASVLREGGAQPLVEGIQSKIDN